MDKHFQDFLHYPKHSRLGCSFRIIWATFWWRWPASWLARKLGYKGGIISGLFLVSLGGFWFIAATHISTFWSFLLGVCLIAMGLTILETVANPYTTVLGPKKYAATRINFAQSFNGVGWILGPIIGGAFFYSTQGVGSRSAATLYSYMVVAIIVLVMAVIFYLQRFLIWIQRMSTISVIPQKIKSSVPSGLVHIFQERSCAISIRCGSGGYFQFFLLIIWLKKFQLSLSLLPAAGSLLIAHTYAMAVTF